MNVLSIIYMLCFTHLNKVASGAITDTENISIYIHIMDINTTAPHAFGWGELLISKIKRKCSSLPCPVQTISCFDPATC